MNWFEELVIKEMEEGGHTISTKCLGARAGFTVQYFIRVKTL